MKDIFSEFLAFLKARVFKYVNCTVIYSNYAQVEMAAIQKSTQFAGNLQS